MTKLNRKTKLTMLFVILTIPLLMLAGAKLGNRYYYLISIVIMALSMIPFFVSFESRKPQARELVVLAVMTAIAVISRSVFIALPAFKPMTAIIMITAMAFGAQAGFMTGCMSAFVSNFVFSQGPWTPWQMFAYGLAGFITGLLAETGVLKKEKKWPVVIYGGLLVLLVVGPFLDICTLFLTAAMPTSTSASAVLLSGLPYNAVHATATVVVLALLYSPIMEKLDRIKVKYGMMEDIQ